MHGHTWKVKVGFVGPVNQKTGMIVDFSDVKGVIHTLDHHSLNSFIENPTAENIALYLAEKLNILLASDGYLEFIEVWESDKSMVRIDAQSK
jgi:6-pyruvoyltetrahydropterin/6-carboxytetrahydropterin synthase